MTNQNKQKTKTDTKLQGPTLVFWGHQVKLDKSNRRERSTFTNESVPNAITTLFRVKIKSNHHYQDEIITGGGVRQT